MTPSTRPLFSGEPMDLRLLREWIRNPLLLEGLSGHDLETLLREFPAFEAGQLLSLQRMKLNHSSRFAKAMASYSAMTDQGQWLYRALERQALGAQDVVHAQPDQDSEVVVHQDSEVDTRLGWFALLGHVDWKSLENDELDTLYQEYTQTDYLEASSEIPAQMDSLKLSATERTDGAKVQEYGGSEMDKIREMAAKSLDMDEIPVSESLAELYLLQGQKAMATRTFRRLMLRFPAKSSYYLTRIEQI